VRATVKTDLIEIHPTSSTHGCLLPVQQYAGSEPLRPAELLGLPRTSRTSPCRNFGMLFANAHAQFENGLRRWEDAVRGKS
jgi:hypothetical protein